MKRITEVLSWLRDRLKEEREMMLKAIAAREPDPMFRGRIAGSLDILEELERFLLDDEN